MNVESAKAHDFVNATNLLFGRMDALTSMEEAQVRTFLQLKEGERMDKVREIGLKLGRKSEAGEMCAMEVEARMTFGDGSKERSAFLDGMDQSYDETQS